MIRAMPERARKTMLNVMIPMRVPPPSPWKTSPNSPPIDICLLSRKRVPLFAEKVIFITFYGRSMT
jgi:hypothetical protein